jgi:hypothetical protein
VSPKPAFTGIKTNYGQNITKSNIQNMECSQRDNFKKAKSMNKQPTEETTEMSSELVT